MAAYAARVVEKRDQLGLHLPGAVLDVGAKHRVGLPELIGVRFGERQTTLVFHFSVGLEQLVGLGHTAEGIRGDALALEQSPLDAGAVDGRHVGRTAEAAAHLLDGFEHLLGRHLAGLTPVRAGLGLHGRDAVFLVPRVPSLDGAPGELEALSVFVEEHLLADVTDSRNVGGAGRRLDCAEHAHLQIAADSFHEGPFRALRAPALQQ